MELKRISNKNVIICSIICLVITLFIFYKQHNSDAETYKIYNSILDNYIEETKYNTDVSMNSIVSEYLKDKDTTTIKDNMNEARTKLNTYVSYINNYSDTLKQYLIKSDELLNVSIFKDKNTFEFQNILKSKSDITNIQDVKVEYVNGESVERVVDFSINGIAILLLLILIINQFIIERKKGLWDLIYCTPNGRMGLAFKRFGILCLYSLIYSILFNISSFVISSHIYGGVKNWTAPIQSIQSFEIFPYKLNIIEFCAVYIFVQAVFIFSVSLVIWFFFMLIKNISFSWIFALGFLFIETLLYLLVPTKSVFRILNYVNVIQLVLPKSSLLENRNWGYGGIITDKFETSIIAALFLLVFFGIANIIIYSLKKPYSKKSILDKLMNEFSKINQVSLSKLPLILKEFYKSYIIQKGFIVLILGIFLVKSCDRENGIIYNVEMISMNIFYEQANNLSYGEELDNIISGYEDKLESSIENNRPDYEIEDQKKILNNIYEINNYLKMQSDKHSDARVINPYDYNDIIQYSDSQQLTIDFIVLLTLIMISFGILSYENKQSMVTVLRSAKGRNKVWNLKTAVLIVNAFFVMLLLYGIEAINIINIYDIDNLDAPIKSLMYMKDFPLNISIKGFFIFLFIEKLCLNISILMGIMLLTKSKSYISAMIISISILIPHILYIAGFEIFKYFSLVIPNTYTVLWNLYGNNFKTYITWIIIFMCGICMWLFGKRQWKYK